MVIDLPNCIALSDDDNFVVFATRDAAGQLTKAEEDSARHNPALAHLYGMLGERVNYNLRQVPPRSEVRAQPAVLEPHRYVASFKGGRQTARNVVKEVTEVLRRQQGRPMTPHTPVTPRTTGSGWRSFG